MEVNTSNLDTNFEKWASIDGYLNYQVSWWGRVLNTKTGRILKAGLSSRGYRFVILSKNGKHKYITSTDSWLENGEQTLMKDHALTI